MVKSFRTSFVICIAIVSLAMSGCATVALMPDKLDATAKRFSPSPGKANIYVTRTGSLMGMGHLFTVYLDGKLVGSIARNTYLLLEVAPGEHRLLLLEVVPGDHRLLVIAPRLTQDSLTLDAQAARNYFVEVDDAKPIFGKRIDVSLKELKQEEGRNAVRDAKRAEPSLPSTQPVLVLLRVTSEVDGEPYEALQSHGIYLSLRGIETGGEANVVTMRYLPKKARKDGWTYFMLAPGTFYLAAESLGMLVRSGGPLGVPLWRFDVPFNTKLVYIGTLHADALDVRNEKKEAFGLAAEYFPEFGVPKTTLLQLHEGPLIF